MSLRLRVKKDRGWCPWEARVIDGESVVDLCYYSDHATALKMGMFWLEWHSKERASEICEYCGHRAVRHEPGHGVCDDCTCINRLLIEAHPVGARSLLNRGVIFVPPASVATL